MQAKVWLIAITAINTATADTTIAAIDSFITDNYGFFGKDYASFATAWPNSMRIKAALDPGDANYADYLPTYYSDSIGFRTPRPENEYGNTLSWRDARPLSSAELTAAEIAVNMIHGTNPGGPGFIGGSVLLGANKSAAVGDPLSSRLLILTKSTGEAVAYIYSDANGHFSFPSVPLGSYRIFGDALGKSNPALDLTLTAAQNRINDIVFEENSKKFEGHRSGLAVSGQPSMEGISIFPNPAHDFLTLQGLSGITGDKTIVLLNMTGAEISRQTNAKDEAVVRMAELPAGIYLLRVQSAEGVATFKVTK
jgi:hypothetical protein